MPNPSDPADLASAPIDQLRAILGSRRPTLVQNLISFAQLCKLSGLDVTTGRVIDAARSLAAIDVSRRPDVRSALRACLVSNLDQSKTFETLFDLYWSRQAVPLQILTRPEPSESASSRAESRQAAARPASSNPAAEPVSENPAQTYSAVDLLTSKDFSTFSGEDLHRGRRVLQQLAPKLASALSRRRRPARAGGAIDLRRSIRRSIRHGGELIELSRMRRRVRKLRLVVLCDVSGSMDIYSRFLVQFLYALQNELRGVSTFVFSTRLNEVTHLLRTQSFDEALERIALHVDAWSGGTSIGASLFAFDRRYARRRIGSRTVLLIISDGWDRGDTGLLKKAMQSLQRRAFKIVWLNPLLGHAEYRPLAKGMAAALPYIDHFLPAHNLDSLERLGRMLVRLSRD
jgi:uncharacterized protein